MTMPHMMNCAHQGEGWCLDCVNRLATERYTLLDSLTEALGELDRLKMAYAYGLASQVEPPDMAVMLRASEAIVQAEGDDVTTCPRCEGAGRYYRLPGDPGSTCGACGGTGRLGADGGSAKKTNG